MKIWSSPLPYFPVPAISLQTGDITLDKAFRIALGDIMSNIVPFKDGLLEQEECTLLAGLDYDTSWTRDAAINAWNGTSLLFPDIMRSTLLSVLKRDGETISISGQYWDAIIWAIGAWWHHLYTGDDAFLTLAFEAICNSLKSLEENEFSPTLNLFRGPACSGDSIGAYPDIYAQPGSDYNILNWTKSNPDLVATPGYGLPMHALSTNCLYYQTYSLLEPMASELGYPIDPSWHLKAEKLKVAINKHFWNPITCSYRYLIDPFGDNECQEGLGHALTLLFHIASPERAQALLQNQHVTRHGIPCIWPPFERYTRMSENQFGRHCGVIWPHVQALWADGALQHGYDELFENELIQLATKACRDSHFAEIYHPITGEMYSNILRTEAEFCYIGEERPSGVRQTWSATGYLRMILHGLFGLTFDTQGITFAPHLLPTFSEISLNNLPYRNMFIDIDVDGTGSSIQHCTIDGQSVTRPFLPAIAQGHHYITLHMAH